MKRTLATLERLLLARPRLSVAALGAVLALAELAVAARSPLLGSVLILATLALAFTIARAHRTAQAPPLAAAEPSFLETLSGLPNRDHLIDQLAREMARSQRYHHALTIATIAITQIEELRTAWGEETPRRAIVHVAETLGRVTRASDYLASLGEGRFVTLLIECSEEQGARYADRAALAVSNRPLRSTTSLRVPLYVAVGVTLTQYHADRYRGPLDLLSAAGGDLPVESPVRGRSLAYDPQALRRQLVHDYYPEGEMPSFADAYREQRGRGRRVV